MTSEQAYYSKGFSKEVSDTHSWRTVSNAVPYVIPYLKKSDKLLDVGLGPGTILRDFANYVGEVIGVEPTQELVDIASSQPDLPSLVKFQLALVYNLPFEDNTFDIVHALQVVIHLAEPVKALKEMLRVCKPGGYVLLKDGDLKMMLIYPEKYEQVITGFFQQRPRDLTTLAIAGRLLKAWAMAAGYEPSKIGFSALVWTISSDSDREHWANMYCKRIADSNESDYAANKKRLDGVIEAFGAWKRDPEGVILAVNGELVYQK